MKQKAIMNICDGLKRVGKPKFKGDTVSGTISYNMSIATLKEGVDVLSEDEVLRIIGERVVNLIRTGV